jgi:hypothetical protein
LLRLPVEGEEWLKFTFAERNLLSKPQAYEAQARAFFRGRVDEGGRRAFAVASRGFKDLVVVKISQDRDDLVRRFGKDVAAKIKDQFAGQVVPKGSMHKGKALAYVLTLKNPTFKPLHVAYRRSLADAAKSTPIDQEPVELEIPAGESRAIKGKVASGQMPPDGLLKLVVELSVRESPEKIKPFTVEFEQIDYHRYMIITQGNALMEHEGRIQPCFCVTYFRRLDDPVTEPIPSEEIECEIEGVPTEKKLGRDYLLWPGKDVKTKTSYDPSRKYNWKGRIGDEVVTPKAGP